LVFGLCFFAALGLLPQAGKQAEAGFKKRRIDLYRFAKVTFLFGEVKSQLAPLMEGAGILWVLSEQAVQKFRRFFRLALKATPQGQGIYYFRMVRVLHFQNL